VRTYAEKNPGCPTWIRNTDLRVGSAGKNQPLISGRVGLASSAGGSRAPLRDPGRSTALQLRESPVNCSRENLGSLSDFEQTTGKLTELREVVCFQRRCLRFAGRHNRTGLLERSVRAERAYRDCFRGRALRSHVGRQFGSFNHLCGCRSWIALVNVLIGRSRSRDRKTMRRSTTPLQTEEAERRCCEG
jgi:hypothetical protein